VAEAGAVVAGIRAAADTVVAGAAVVAAAADTVENVVGDGNSLGISYRRRRLFPFGR
jgi:hypothetical protein